MIMMHCQIPLCDVTEGNTTVCGFVLHCTLAMSESLSGVHGHIPAEVMIVLDEVIMQMVTSRSFQRLCDHIV